MTTILIIGLVILGYILMFRNIRNERRKYKDL